MRLTLLVAALGLTLVGCDSAPSDPTWHDDVKPILVANCIKCHGATPRGGAPSSFRLDRYAIDAFSDVGGATAVSQFIHVRTDAEQMPPVSRLSPRQIDILDNWREAIALGDPDPDNAPPELLTSSVDAANESVTISYNATDPDLDTLAGNVFACPSGDLGCDGVTGILIDRLGASQGQAAWQTANVVPDDYQIFIELSDEANVARFDLGSVTVAHTDTKPTITLCSPRNPELTQCTADPSYKFALTDADTSLRIGIDDPQANDTAVVTVSVERGDERFTIGTSGNLAVGIREVSLDTSMVPAGPGWTLVVEAGGVETKHKNTVIGHGEAQSSFAPIQTIFETYCNGCHGANAQNPVFFLDFSEADSFLFRGGYYFRVVQEQTMPPRSAELILDQPRMPDNAREALKQWLLTAPQPPPPEPMP